jgi:glycosyltransferase involved in cell wall biosynthesis
LAPRCLPSAFTCAHPTHQVIEGKTIEENSPLLTIIVPAYNEERRLPKSLAKIATFVAAQSYEIELIVVDNNSRDRTPDIVREFSGDHPYTRLIHEKRQGKGAAVRAGIFAGRGDYLFICDSDLAMPIDEVNKFLPPQREGADVAIASREAPGARRYNEPQYRHLMGRVFNLIVQILAVPGINDTQCGFKCFRRPVGHDIFAAQTMEGFGFDVEILFIARRRGYEIVEVPVNWYYDPGTSVNLLRDPFRMVGEVLQVRLNGWRGTYDA